MSELPPYLYRGFARGRSEETAAGLRPKQTGQSFEYVFKVGEIIDGSTGEVLRVGAGAVVGSSDVNAVVRHQSDPDLGWRDCGMSTTPHVARAEYYATAGHTGQPGSVVVIDTSLLEQHNVRWYRVRDYVRDPSLPKDDEYILVSEDDAELPEAIVTRRFDV